MLQKSTLAFLTDLKRNNNKEWFECNRVRYEAAREDVMKLATKVIEHLSVHNKDFKNLQAKDCMFRINRDVRFSKDKAPYKTNMGIYFNTKGKKSDTPGYYLHIEPEKHFVAAGCWMPQGNMLSQIRQEIDYNLPVLNQILSTKELKKYFPDALSKNDALKRPPKGYDDKNAAIKFLKLKSFVISAALSDRTLLAPNAAKVINNMFDAAAPFVDFLSAALV